MAMGVSPDQWAFEWDNDFLGKFATMKSSRNEGFSIAMFEYQRVANKKGFEPIPRDWTNYNNNLRS